jgi:serine/threonine protein kinase
MVGNLQSDVAKEAASLKNELEKFDRVFIDTCSIIKIEEESLEFWNWATKAIIEMRGTPNEKRILLPKAVFIELYKHINAAKPKAGQTIEEFNKLKQNSTKAVARLTKLKAEGVIDIIGDQNDSDFADNVFTGVFERFKTKYSMLIITNDRGLATAIKATQRPNAAVSYNIKEIKAVRITNHGTLGQQDGHGAGDSNSSRSSANSKKMGVSGVISKKISSKTVPKAERFKLATKISTAGGQLQVSVIPKEGDTITADSNGDVKSVTLGKELASGGEGSVFAIKNNKHFVAKIYKHGKITAEKEAKLKLIITKGITCEGICFPMAILTNSQRQFVGYLMPVAKGKELGKTIFIPPKFRKEYPSWTRKDTVQLCITILEKMKYLHDRNIVLGDINPANILFVSPKEVYFVDTDSYQIEGYICPVGTVNFTPPEILGKDFKTIVRNLETDRYSIAVLLFEIMLPGRHPYTTTGEQCLEDNAKKGYFPYPFLDNSGKSVPYGQWRYIWSYLPTRRAVAPEIKGAFYQTFEHGEKYNAPPSRLSAEKWLDLFLQYKAYLADPKTKRFDEQQLSIFPTRLKRPSEKFELCPTCRKNWFDSTQFSECFECSQSNISTCKHCGKKFMSPQNRPNAEYCYDHREMGWTRSSTYGKQVNTRSAVNDKIKQLKKGSTYGKQVNTRSSYVQKTNMTAATIGAKTPQSKPQQVANKRATKKPHVKPQQAATKNYGTYKRLALAVIVLIAIIGSCYSWQLTPQAKLGVSEPNVHMLPGTALYYTWDEYSPLGGWNYKVYSMDYSYSNITVHLDIAESHSPEAEVVGTAEATLSYVKGNVTKIHFDAPEYLDSNKVYYGGITWGKYD